MVPDGIFSTASSIGLLDQKSPESWKKFKQRFELYLEAIDKATAADKTKKAILLTVAGEEAISVQLADVYKR